MAPRKAIESTRAACRSAALTVLLTIACTMPVAAAEPIMGLEGPDVTIIETEDRTVLEFRQSGQLRMVKVVPDWGKPYYLYPRDPTTGYGDLEKADMLLPTWVIVEF